jgi:hypothetical protein
VKLHTTRAVIDAFGGNKRFADAMRDGSTPQAVNNWGKPKARFPANRYPTITEMLDVAGISISNDLYTFRKRRR